MGCCAGSGVRGRPRLQRAGTGSREDHAKAHAVSLSQYMSEAPEVDPKRDVCEGRAREI